ncbi:MAG: MBOAT family protein [Acidobacteriota bacterium]|nr:MBOAT family protein [Acidobacteriota bacterium]
MVFSSYLFVFYFLPLALLVYYAAPRFLRHLLLTALSYLFYGWANPAFMILMLFSTAVDYLCGRVLVAGHPDLRLEPGGPRSSRQRWAVAVSVITNLSLLGFFKYFNFAVDSANALLATAGLEAAQLDSVLRIALPLGISFYTFQSMSYTIDVYRGDSAALRSPVDFACYVSLFPQLVAGPIIRFSEVADQLRSRTHTVVKFSRGVAFFSLGMAKKVLLANPCGRVADLAFDAGSIGTLDAWVGALGYSFQIYFDFSGYSDMAIGLGLMLGFVFPKNFDSPYRSRSITEFWRRWHISLSSWLRDYLYVPLGGNRKGRTRTYINLMLVMLLGGLWHGAAWTFVVWGGLHGVWLALERARGKESFYHRLPAPAQTALTFLVVLVGWVFFRAADLPSALAYLGSMFGLVAAAPSADLLAGALYTPYHLLCLGLAAAIAWGAPQTWDWTRQLTVARAATALALFWLALTALLVQGFNPFIYFIF